MPSSKDVGENGAKKASSKSRLVLVIVTVLIVAVSVAALIAVTVLMQEEIECFAERKTQEDQPGDVTRDTDVQRSGHEQPRAPARKQTTEEERRLYRTKRSTCEPVTIPMCQNVSYKLTLFPNSLSHRTQEEAALAIRQYVPLVKTDCSPFLVPFLCSVYAPPCDGSQRVIPPCKELCKRATKSCGSLLNRFHLTWPSELRCKRFPKEGESTCLSGPRTTTKPTSLTGKCQARTLPVCRGLASEFTQFPNVLGHKKQKQASVGIKQFDPLLKADCSPVMAHFLCSVFAPPCRRTKLPLPPCREFCELARSDCRSVIKQTGFNWPRDLKCKHFPRQGQEPCDNGPTNEAATTPPTSSVCQPIDIPICQGLVYNTTMFPNFFNHTTQKEAATEVQQFFPLVQVGCSPDLAFFLCSMYAPICTELLQVIPPCRHICTQVRNGCLPLMLKYGFTWPEHYSCERFPKLGDSICVGDPLPTQVATTSSSVGTCEPLTIPMCRGLHYNMTLFPNSLQHDTQDEAAFIISQFSPLVRIGCSPDLALFLCSVYAPPCSTTQRSQPPCKKLCTRVKNGCLPLLQKYGISWPDIWACDKFPNQGQATSCISGTTSVQATTSPLTTGTCEEITIPMCSGLQYNMTQFPNLLKHQTQKEAGLEAEQFLPLVKVGCSPDLALFLCSVYAPPCNTTQPPCKELCTRVQNDCLPLMQRFRFSWPDSLACDRFPNQGQATSCIGGTTSVQATTSPPTTGRCEALTIPMCTGLQYNMTLFPNLLKHRTQEEAALEVHQFFPLVQVGCSPDLAFFLCSIYAPICTALSSPVPPCRHICTKVKDGCLPIMVKYGFTWPDHLSCDKFPILAMGDSICIGDSSTTQAITTTSPSVGTCEAVTIPMCTGLQYNMTRFPNLLKHRTQEEAALEVHQFFPLVKVGCSPDLALFLCSVYAPPCNTTQRSQPPCKEFCTRVQKDCLPLIRRFGFSWPDSLACDRFPNQGQATSCISGTDFVQATTSSVPTGS